jgi:hypothetical protein
VFVLPGLGVVGMAGPIAATPVGALEGPVVVGGLSALGAALTQIGVPKDQVIKYEAALKVDKFLLVVHGSTADQDKARAMLAQAKTPVEAPSDLPREHGHCVRAVRHRCGRPGAPLPGQARNHPNLLQVRAAQFEQFRQRSIMKKTGRTIEPDRPLILRKHPQTAGLEPLRQHEFARP